MIDLYRAAFEAMLQRSGDYVLLLDREFRILAAGTSFAATFLAGRDPRGADFLEILDLESRAKAGAVLQKGDESAQGVELNLVTPAREIRLVRFGFLALDGPEGRPAIAAIGHDQQEMLRLVESVVRLNADLEEARFRFERLALTDPLTGLGNRRWLFDRLESLWSNARRDGRFCWVVMADMDHFKPLNDRYGHMAGDAVLAAVADALRRSIRRGDLAARYGGEEFCLAGTCTHPSEAVVVADRLVDAIRSLRIPHPDGPLRVTASVGVAPADPSRYPDPWPVLCAADAALYRAKSSGRDRLAVADPSELDPPPPTVAEAATA